MLKNLFFRITILFFLICFGILACSESNNTITESNLDISNNSITEQEIYELKSKIKV